MPTFGGWEATVLEHCYDEADYISLHAYYGQDDDLPASSPPRSTWTPSSTASSPPPTTYAPSCAGPSGSSSPSTSGTSGTDRFHGGPPSGSRRRALIEDAFDVADAVVVGGLLISLLKHADRVGVACQAQLANILAPIRTEPGGPAWRQTIFHPFAHAGRVRAGRRAAGVLDAPRYETAQLRRRAGVDAVATRDDEGVTVFAVNRDVEERVGLTLDPRAFPGVARAERIVLADDDRGAANTAADPARVTPRR